jgi:GNAT superfamily N-acetyltransferase
VAETLPEPGVVLRPRVPADIAPLGAALMAQQPSTRYPFRNPLPVPVEDFLHASDAVAAWTAEVDGLPVGHVCRVRPLSGFPEAASMNEACAQAHGCPVGELAWVSTLFVGFEGRGLGIGGLLHDAVVEDIRAAGLRPCLEVLPIHAAALALYRARGWREVATVRPQWLVEAGGDDVLVMMLDEEQSGGR